MQMADGGGGGGYPPLAKAGKESRIDRDALRDVFDALDRDFKAYDSWTNPGTYKYLTDGEQGRVKMLDLGDDGGNLYPAAQGLYQSSENAYNKISSAYSQFLEAYQTLVENIKSSAHAHSRAEEANEQNFRTTGSANRSQFYGGETTNQESSGGGGSW
jgi:hypothetical protein